MYTLLSVHNFIATKPFKFLRDDTRFVSLGSYFCSCHTLAEQQTGKLDRFTMVVR